MKKMIGQHATTTTQTSAFAIVSRCWTLRDGASINNKKYVTSRHKYTFMAQSQVCIYDIPPSPVYHLPVPWHNNRRGYPDRSIHSFIRSTPTKAHPVHYDFFPLLDMLGYCTQISELWRRCEILFY